MILACSEALGWFPINKKFGLKIPWMLTWVAVVCWRIICVNGLTGACANNEQ